MCGWFALLMGLKSENLSVGQSWDKSSHQQHKLQDKQLRLQTWFTVWHCFSPRGAFGQLSQCAVLLLFSYHTYYTKWSCSKLKFAPVTHYIVWLTLTLLCWMCNYCSCQELMSCFWWLISCSYTVFWFYSTSAGPTATLLIFKWLIVHFHKYL